jgi:hypothetical protein
VVVGTGSGLGFGRRDGHDAVAVVVGTVRLERKQRQEGRRRDLSDIAQQTQHMSKYSWHGIHK